MVFGMVILGGVVRLTGAGLSMVNWQPLLGILPPIGEAAWLRAFEQYQQFPEYQLVNHGMSLPQFRVIFLLEYAHRIAGRLLGMVFCIPFVFFLFKGVLSAALQRRLWLLLLLGVGQGLMGWYMIMSGLIDNPYVSHYRLTAHLVLAVLIYSWLLRLIFGLVLSSDSSNQTRRRDRAPLFFTAAVMQWLILLMIATGGLVAGTKAGFIYNSWPKMGADWMPALVSSLTPWWRNFVDNPIAIQFLHRWLAIIIGVAVVVFAWAVRRQAPRLWIHGFAILAMFAVIIQIMLGIGTLLYRVPVPLAVAHQGGALLLLTAIIGIGVALDSDRRAHI